MRGNTRILSVKIPIGIYEISLSLIYDIKTKNKKHISPSFAIIKKVFGDRFIGGHAIEYIYHIPKSETFKRGNVFGFCEWDSSSVDERSVATEAK